MLSAFDLMPPATGLFMSADSSIKNTTHPALPGVPVLRSPKDDMVRITSMNSSEDAFESEAVAAETDIRPLKRRKTIQ